MDLFATHYRYSTQGATNSHGYVKSRHNQTAQKVSLNLRISVLIGLLQLGLGLHWIAISSNPLLGSSHKFVCASAEPFRLLIKVIEPLIRAPANLFASVFAGA